MPDMSTIQPSFTPICPSFGSANVKPILRHSGAVWAAFVVGVVDQRLLDVVKHLRLVGGIVLDAAMPIEMVVGDVGNRRAVKFQRIGEMQLERAQFDAEHVVRRVDGGVRHGFADVANGGSGQAACGQHFGGHFRGRGLAVGAGDADPLRRLAGGVAVHAQLPGQFDFAHDRYVAFLRLKDEWRARVEDRRGHHHVGIVPIDLVEGMQVGVRLLLIHAQHSAGTGAQHFHHALPGDNETSHDYGLAIHIHIHHPSIGNVICRDSTLILRA